MKILVLVVVSIIGSVASAKTRVDFERETASSNKNSLSAAFQNAVKGSDADLDSTKSVVLVEENARIANWQNNKKKQIVVIPGTAAIDQATVNSEAQTIGRESQIDTEKALKDELKGYR